MLRIRTGAPRGLRWGVFSAAPIVAFLALSSIYANAAPYSDIVVDGNTGAVLHSTSPDAKRHPASLTKIMTLYLLFEQLEAGKLKLDSALKISQEAAEQSPTKLGLRPGTTIQVEDAIKGIITRSANDAAVVVAEAIAGDEDDFAELMTKKARALGMTNTVYKNASGLPDDDQITTARDQSILGRAIQERFPKYYKYFQTRSFTFRGQWIANHNHLLGRVDGVDGIKTGYIRASGFNLVTSVHRGNRYLVAVVLGGASAGIRDARMRELIGSKIAMASTKRSAPMVAELAQPEAKPEPKVVAKIEPKVEPKLEAKAEPKVEAKVEPKVEAKPEPKVAAKSDTKDQHRFAVASMTSTPVKLDQPTRGAAATSEPIRPVLVRTVTVRPGATQTAALAPPTNVPEPAAPAPVAAPLAPVAPQAAAPVAPAAVTAPVAPQAAAPVAPKVEALPPPPPGARPGVLGVLPARAAETTMPTTPAYAPVAAPTPAAPAKPIARSGWMIQVGAFAAELEAKQRLTAVQTKASKVLDGTDPFTESVEKGGSTYYRARFAGFDRDKAEAACKVLKRDGVECVTIRN